MDRRPHHRLERPASPGGRGDRETHSALRTRLAEHPDDRQRGGRDVYGGGGGAGAAGAGTWAGAAIEPGVGQTASAHRGADSGLAGGAAPVALPFPASAVPALYLS